MNMKKTKAMFNGQNLNKLLDSGMGPCRVCRSGVAIIVFSARDASTGYVKCASEFVADL